MQLEFTPPDFVQKNSPEEIHERMMKNLPADIDGTPGGFPYDFTMPAAIEKAEVVQYHMVRALMAAFPQFAWDDWLDYHGRQVHLTRHPAKKARVILRILGTPGTEIAAGTVFCVPATQYTPAVGFSADADCVIDGAGMVEIAVTAMEEGPAANVKADAIVIMEEPADGITAVTNPQPAAGGAMQESDDDFYDRIAEEYANSKTFLGNDNDYRRWAKEAGAGDCIVDAAFDGPGTVKLVLVDTNGHPAGSGLVQAVYDYIVSPHDRARRLLPTACAKLSCVPAETLSVDYTCTGILYDGRVTDPVRISLEFEKAVNGVYAEAKREGVLRYNDIRPILRGIDGLEDFEAFYVNGGMENILLGKEEYPVTGVCRFCVEGSDGED